MSRLRIAAPLLALLAAGSLPAAAQDVAAKRAEGRYFVELAEIMITSEDFDLVFAHDDPGGPRVGEGSSPVVAETPRNHLEAPKFTIGLNRPSGKSAFSFSFHDFDMLEERIPQDFDREGFVTTSTLLPPGVVFQRQAQPSTRYGLDDDDFVPNWGTDWAFRLLVEQQVSSFTYERNAYENENFRLRWLGGVTYGRLKQHFAHALAYEKEFSPGGIPDIGLGGGVSEEQDFFFAIAEVHTRGLGPKLGLDGRWLLDKNKKWSVEARAEVAFIPETTSVSYQLNLVDASTELFLTEQPVIPGLPTEALFDYETTFATSLSQNDFTDMVMLATGNVGVRWQANKYVTVGLDLWQQRWMNVLSNTGLLTLVNEETTFDFLVPVLGASGGANPDPQLQDSESILNLPRLASREDFTFDGINLNFRFQF